jgi:uncharacterized protein (TIGR02996 family)
MNDEGALLDTLVANLRDDTLRQVYADWLEERGDSRGEFLRTESALATPPEDQRQTKKLRARLSELRAGIDASWLALIDRAPIEGCFQFHIKCPQRWETLKPTGDISVRFCETCRKKVFHCGSLDHAQRHALRGHCVAVDSRLFRKPGDLLTDPTCDPESYAMLLGRPEPPLPRYRVGQRVNVRRGPHRGLRGEVEQVHLSILRLTVAMPLAQGRASVDLDFEDLEEGRES